MAKSSTRHTQVNRKRLEDTPHGTSKQLSLSLKHKGPYKTTAQGPLNKNKS